MSIWVKLEFEECLVDPSTMLMGSFVSGSPRQQQKHMLGRDIEWEAFFQPREQGWLGLGWSGRWQSVVASSG